ncbi:MAG TPA: hypothetical protein DCE07_02880 [Peptococcaceae bacterium]|nr:hypothetical protein [Peptococcaceae bacterium]
MKISPTPSALPDPVNAAILEVTDALIVVYDSEGRIVFFNPACEKLTGYRAHEVIGHLFWETLFIPEEKEEAKKVFDSVKTKKTPWRGKKYWVTKQGELRSILWSCTIVPAENGFVSYMVSTGVDVTEEEKIKEALREGNRWLEALLQSIGDAVIATDAFEKVTFMNPAAERLTGWDNSEVHGVPIGKVFRIIDEKSRQPLENIVRGVLESKKSHHKSNDFLLVNRKGEELPIEYTCTPILSEEKRLLGAVLVFRDISERRKRERALQESEQRFRLIAENARDIVFRYRLLPEPGFEYVNPATKAISGYSPEDHYADPDFLFKIIHPEDRSLLEKLMAGDPSLFQKHLALRWIGADGRIVFTEQTNVPIYDDQGKLIAIEGIARDITVRKEMEEALRRSEYEKKVILESISDTIFYLDREMKIVWANRIHPALQNKTEEELVNRTCFEVMFSKKNPCKDCPVQKTFQSGQVEEKEITAPDGRIYWVCSHPIDVPEKETAGVVVTHRDITDRKKAEERIRYLSFHDSLTGLYNRAFFEEELKRLDVPRQLPLSIIIGDLNGLKLVNDAFGHQVADELLRKAAELIKSCCRKEDIVARWGGDEFIILLPQTSLEEAKSITKRIEASFQRAEADPIKPSISLGYATKSSPEKKIDEVIRIAEDWVYQRKLFESKSQHHAIISSLEQTLWEVTQETREHAKRVQKISRKIGEAIGLSERELEELELLARLHDIGKVTVPREILNKEGPLTPEEWKIVKRHVEAGYRIAQSSYELAPIAEAILYHHERWDGKGYPQGLKGEEIPLLSRILAIADAYEVMTTGRPYRRAVSREEAVEEIRRNAGTQFDPHLVEVFLKVVSDI